MNINDLQAAIILITGLFLVALMVSDYLRQKVDLISIRNLLLFGFLVYQVISPSAVLLTQVSDTMVVMDLERAGWKYLLLMGLFLCMFLLAYNKGWGAPSLARKIPIYRRELTSRATLIAAVIFTCIAFFTRLIPPLPAIGFALFFIALGSATTSTGLITWWWLRRPANLGSASLAFIIVSTNTLIMLSSSFSRRPLIAIFLMFVWVVYYGRVRYFHSRVRVVTAIFFAALPLILLASLFTAARDHDNRDRNSFQIVQNMMLEGGIREGFVDLAGGQLVGEASLWCCENFPEHFPSERLLSLRYYFLANIPRNIWPDKPLVLSTRIAYLADVEGVDQSRAFGGGGVTLPPGIIGYVAADGGWYAALIYGLVIGLLARFLDEMVTLHAFRTGVAIPVAASLGNVVGFLRGDLAHFAMATTWTIIASFLLIFIATYLLGGRPYTTPRQYSYLAES